MDRHIPLIISEGTPFERGLHLGRSAQSRVLHTVTAYMEIFQRISALSREDVYTHAERFIPAIAGFAPHLLEEMRGMAEGAGCELREIVAINARTELMYGVPHQPECTAIAVSAPASADGHLRLAQNWDWHPSLAGSLILWGLKRSDGLNLVTLTEAGIVGKIGINAAGLAMCINLLKSDSDDAGPAAPMHVILRRVLDEAHSVDEAIALIGNTRRCTSCNHLLADRHGTIADVEATPAGQWAHRSSQGILTHANHCDSPALASQDRYVRENPETRERDKRMQSLATTRPVTEDALHTMLTDHGTSPYAICVHNQAQWSFEEQGESVASIIFDLAAGTIDVADGPPCQYEYQRYSIDKLTSYQRTNY